MKQYFKRVLVLLLTVSIVAGSSPFTALADEVGATNGREQTDSKCSISEDGGAEAFEPETAEKNDDTDKSVSDDTALKKDLDILGDDIDVTARDSVGEILAEAMLERKQEQNDFNGCSIISVSFNGQTAFVDLETIEDAKVVVGIYDEKTNKLLASGESSIIHYN